MVLIPLVGRAEIAKAYFAYEQALHAGGQPLVRSLGWHGGGEDGLELYWHSPFSLWVCTRPIENRYWCAFGTREPVEGQSLSIVCEINIPFEGINRRVAGVFARDEGGRVCLLHSGKVGGGKAGVGKETFLEYFNEGRRVMVRWPDGQETRPILLGWLGDGDLLERIAEFVRLVERFKGQVGSAAPAETKPNQIDEHHLSEDEILIAGALRFRGYDYQERHGFDFRPVVRRFLDTGRWPETEAAQLATLFMLQRYLYKWGGEYEPKHGGYWRAFRSLFLHTHLYVVPDEFRHREYAERWDQVYRPFLDAAVGVVLRIHEKTRYVDDAEPGRLGNQ
jgi:hypothetical protein